MRTGWIVVLVTTFLTASAAAGQDGGLRKLLTGDDSRGWEAVGRLDFAGRAFCTGALIAPDLVLTAAHCLFDVRNGRQVASDTIEFRAGWRNRRANAVATVAQAIAHPKFQFKPGEKVDSVRFDLALLRLKQPIRKSSVKPFEIGTRPRKGARVSVVSYARNRSESPSLQEDCKVLARRSGTLVMSCNVDFGASGAPVFSIGEGGVARVVSVISAKAEIGGREVALGLRLEEPLADLMALMANSETPPPDEKSGVRVLNLGGSDDTSGSGGAKFLRP